MHDASETFPSVAFLRTLNHELRSQVRAISGSIGVAWEELDGKFSDSALPWKQRADDGIATLAQLLEDMSDLTAIDQAVANPSRVAIASVVDRSLKKLRVAPDRVKVACHDVFAYVDVSLLDVVLRELIANGLKFHRNEEAATVSIYVRCADGQNRIEVRDAGIGIDPQFLEQVFDAFERLHPAHHFPGSGLGLFKARMAASKIGAKVELTSSPGEGTVATIVIPAS